MKKSTAIAVAIAALLILALGIAVYAQVTSKSTTGQRGENVRRFQGAGEQAGLGRIFGGLNLSTEQKQKIKDILKQFQTKAQSIQPQIKETRTSLVNLICADSPNNGKIQAARNKLDNLQSALAEARNTALVDCMQMLTAEQREIAKQRLLNPQNVQTQGGQRQIRRLRTNTGSTTTTQ